MGKSISVLLLLMFAGSLLLAEQAFAECGKRYVITEVGCLPGTNFFEEAF